MIVRRESEKRYNYQVVNWNFYKALDFEQKSYNALDFEIKSFRQVIFWEKFTFRKSRFGSFYSVEET